MPTSESQLPVAHDVFIARQPIFDQRKRVYGYELLFRSGLESSCPPEIGEQASRHVLHVAWMELGLSALVGQKLPFVNFTRHLLVSEVADTFPAESLVVEILEDIEPDDEVLDACRQLKKKGYILALDDFIYRPGLEPLIALADIVKIRIGEGDLEEQRDHVLRHTSCAPQFLAEKVETKEDFARATDLGFSYFQGWFFCRPEILSKRTLTGLSLTCLKLMQAVSRPRLNLHEIEQIVRSDLSITYRFLKYLGTAALGLRTSSHNIGEALVWLGEARIRRWVSLVALGVLAEGKPRELLVNAAVRARFCEELAGEVALPDRRSDLFLVGAFSLIDTMLDQRMSEVLVELPLDEELKTALEGRPNILRPVLDYVEAYERGDWAMCGQLGEQLQLDDRRVTHLYRASVAWATESFLG